MMPCRASARESAAAASACRGIIQYRIGTQQRRQSLGDLRKIGVEAARKIARQRFAKIELGIDPVQERTEARAQATARKLTLAVVADRYLDARKDILRPSTYDQVERYLESALGATAGIADRRHYPRRHSRAAAGAHQAARPLGICVCAAHLECVVYVGHA